MHINDYKNVNLCNILKIFLPTLMDENPIEKKDLINYK